MIKATTLAGTTRNSSMKLDCNKLPLFSVLLMLASGVFAADTTAGKSDLSPTATDSYQIRNKKFGDLLRPEGANGAEGTRIVLYPAEPWKCMTWKLRPAGESMFHVQNHFTAKTFIVNTNLDGTNVIQTTLAREAGERPVWRFTKLPDGSYRISDAKSGAVLTATDGAGRPVRVVVAPWQDKDEQKWDLEKTDPAKLTM
jgi:hypothetical protein